MNRLRITRISLILGYFYRRTISTIFAQYNHISLAHRTRHSLFNLNHAASPSRHFLLSLLLLFPQLVHSLSLNSLHSTTTTLFLSDSSQHIKNDLQLYSITTTAPRPRPQLTTTQLSAPRSTTRCYQLGGSRRRERVVGSLAASCFVLATLAPSLYTHIHASSAATHSHIHTDDATATY